MIQQKLVDEISLNFPVFYIIGKYIKIRLKNSKTGVHHAILRVLEVERSKILHKLNKRNCFCLHSRLHFFYGISRAKTDLYI